MARGSKGGGRKGGSKSGGSKGKYRSAKTGRYVSSYYGKRNPGTTVKESK
jgi:hypothetical protein